MRQITPAISSVSRPSSGQRDEVAELLDKMLNPVKERSQLESRQDQSARAQ